MKLNKCYRLVWFADCMSHCSVQRRYSMLSELSEAKICSSAEHRSTKSKKTAVNSDLKEPTAANKECKQVKKKDQVDVSKMETSSEMKGPVAVVTGASQGLGFAIVAELCRRNVPHVYLTARDPVAGNKAVWDLKQEGLRARFHQLDVRQPKEMQQLADTLRERHNGLDMLVNNAAIMDYHNLYPDFEGANKNIETNYRSLHVIEKHLFPLLREGARVVNISSACGTLANLRHVEWLRKLQAKELKVEVIDEFVQWYLDSVRKQTFNKDHFADDGKHAEHRVSKMALTLLTMIWASKYCSRGVHVCALHPGHLRTSMSAGSGAAPPAHGAHLAVWLLLDAPTAHAHNAFLWYDRTFVEWKDHTLPLYYVHQHIDHT